MKTLLLISILLISILPLEALAEKVFQGSAEYTQTGKTIQDHYLKSVSDLIYTYTILVSKLDKIDIIKLQLSQRAWKDFSDADCKCTTGYSQGETLGKAAYQSCLTHKIEDRTNILDQKLRRNFSIDLNLALGNTEAIDVTDLLFIKLSQLC